MAEEDERLSIDELATRGGVSRRTVRYYVQRGLLPRPTGVGRGKHYTPAHLARLIEVRTLQERGVPLATIEGEAAGPVPRPRPPNVTPPERPDVRLPGGSRPPKPTPPRRPPAPGEPWWRAELADGVELHVRGGPLPAETLEALRRLLTSSPTRTTRPGAKRAG
ncbi:MAG: MerR family transcriptional regulator, partial [Myxococcota bacterium]